MVETRDETDATARSASRSTSRRRPTGPRARKGPAAADAGHVCNVAFCPIGLALTAVQPLKPDVVEHLLLAGREFFLAAKALMDVRADELSKDGARPRSRRSTSGDGESQPDSQAVGIDVGGTKTAAARVDRDGSCWRIETLRHPGRRRRRDARDDREAARAVITPTSGGGHRRGGSRGVGDRRAGVRAQPRVAAGAARRVPRDRTRSPGRRGQRQHRRRVGRVPLRRGPRLHGPAVRRRRHRDRRRDRDGRQAVPRRARVRGRDRPHRDGAGRPAVRLREPRMLGAVASGQAVVAPRGPRVAARSRLDAHDGQRGRSVARDGRDGHPGGARRRRGLGRHPRGGRPLARGGDRRPREHPGSRDRADGGGCRRGRRPGARAGESVVSRHGRGRGDAPRRADRRGGARERRRCGGRGGAGPGARPREAGVSLPVFTADPSRPLAVAARAEELGFDGVFSPDHFFPPVFYPPAGPIAPRSSRSRRSPPRRRGIPRCTSGRSSRGSRSARPGSWRSRRRRSIRSAGQGDPGARHGRRRIEARARDVRLPVPPRGAIAWRCWRRP